jgi:hypothetical protein
MTHVRFTENFDWSPKPHVLIAYKAGESHTVKRECAEAAIAAGKAVKEPTPRRDETSDG